MSDLGFEVGPVDSWNGGNPWSISRRPRRRRRSGAALPLEGGSSFQIRPPPPPPFPGRKPWPFGRTVEALWRLGPSWRRRSRGGWGLWTWCVVVGGGGGARFPWLPALVVACGFFRILQRLLTLLAGWSSADSGRPRVRHGLDEGEIVVSPPAVARGGGRWSRWFSSRGLDLHVHGFCCHRVASALPF